MKVEEGEREAGSCCGDDLLSTTDSEQSSNSSILEIYTEENQKTELGDLL